MIWRWTKKGSHTNMTRKQADRLQMDIGKSISPEDFIEDIYISIKGVGTKTFRKCVYHEVDNWIFIWTEDDSYIFNKKDLGDCVIIPLSASTFTLSTN